MSASFEMHCILSRLSTKLGNLQADSNVGLVGTGESTSGRKNAAGSSEGNHSSYV